MKDAPTTASPRLAASSPIWDVAMLVLGLNVWVSLLWVPAVHLERPLHQPWLLALIFVAAPPLVLGVLRRSALLLLLVFPLLLLLAPLGSPPLVGANVTSPWALGFVAASVVGYFVGTALLLHRRRAVLTVDALRPVAGAETTFLWKSRFRIYRWLAALSVAFPVLLVVALHGVPASRQALADHFPGRSASAAALFSLLLLLLWLGVYRVYFVAPLMAHSASDPRLRSELNYLRVQATRRGPRLRFFGYVALALVTMAVLLWRYV